MSYTMNWEEQGNVTSYYGVVDISEVFESDREFYNDPRSDKAKYRIIDFSQATPGLVDESLIEDIAAMDYGASLSIPRLNVAFITKDPYIKELCNQYIQLCMKMNIKWKCMIFEDLDSARKWAT